MKPYPREPSRRARTCLERHPAPLLDAARLLANPDVEEAVVTWTDRLRAESEAKGKAEGRAELVLKQLQLRFGPLDARSIERVRSARSEDLDAFAERVLTAATLAEVLDDGADVVLMLLQLRFGPPDARSIERVRSARHEELLTFFERALYAATLAEVLAD